MLFLCSLCARAPYFLKGSRPLVFFYSDLSRKKERTGYERDICTLRALNAMMMMIDNIVIIIIQNVTMNK